MLSAIVQAFRPKPIPTILVDPYVGKGATASVVGHDLGFVVTLKTGSNPGVGGGRLFRINYSRFLSGIGVVTFSPGDDAGFFAAFNQTNSCYIANPDQTDFELWTNGEVPEFTEFKINFNVVLR